MDKLPDLTELKGMNGVLIVGCTESDRRQTQYPVCLVETWEDALEFCSRNDTIPSGCLGNIWTGDFAIWRITVFENGQIKKRGVFTPADLKDWKRKA